MANGHLETLDRMIAEVGDRTDSLEYKTVSDKYGKGFAGWLLQQGYSTRRSWRKSNVAAESRRKRDTADAGDMRKTREEFAALSAKDPKAAQALLAASPKLREILGIQ